ncbi:MAG: (Fe-S)-binding protein [Desulfobacterales bacterium]|nr:(Fe-S)-binding protein [Desulfobacterales bacterium]
MAAEASKPKDKMLDEGLERGVAGLTEEQIRKVIQPGDRRRNRRAPQGLRGHLHPLRPVLRGLPLSSSRATATRAIRRWARSSRRSGRCCDSDGKVSPDFIKQARIIASTHCNLCKRCAMYCPFGIDVAYLMLVVRRICHLLGVTPRYIQDTAHSHAATINQMWVKDDEWIDTLQWQEEEAQARSPTLRIPLDKEGADIMYSVIGPEPKFQAQLIYQAAVIMNVAGVDWTMPATPGWDNSDMAMFTGDNEIMGRIKRAHFETAARLRVKRIVMGECGHAFRSVYDVGNRWLGWSMPPIPIVHAVDFYHELLSQGAHQDRQEIRGDRDAARPLQRRPRRRPARKGPRRGARAMCASFVEMEPNREHNYLLLRRRRGHQLRPALQKAPGRRATASRPSRSPPPRSRAPRW